MHHSKKERSKSPYFLNISLDYSYIPGSKPRHEVLNVAKQAGLGSHPGFPRLILLTNSPPPIKNKGELFFSLTYSYNSPPSWAMDPSKPVNIIE